VTTLSPHSKRFALLVIALGAYTFFLPMVIVKSPGIYMSENSRFAEARWTGVPAVYSTWPWFTCWCRCALPLYIFLVHLRYWERFAPSVLSSALKRTGGEARTCGCLDTSGICSTGIWDAAWHGGFFHWLCPFSWSSLFRGTPQTA